MMKRTLLTLVLVPSVALAQNDDCSGALALPLGTTAFDTTTATLSAPTWPCAGGGGPDLWYEFTAPSDGFFSFETCGSGYDTALEVFNGGCGALASLSCNDDTCGLQSKVGVLAQTGDVFHLRVGGWNGSSGTGTLTVSQSVPMLNPANGHYYQAIPLTVDWNTADMMASSLSYMGMQGHLATISDQAEDQFVYFTLAGGSLGNAWLGAYQDMTSPTFSEPSGGWTWVTGEPFTYTNWYPGEPNNSGGQEHYLGYWPADQWNDYVLTSGNVGVFVVEYETTNLGMQYCSPAVTNSTGNPAGIHATGTTDIAANDVTLVADDLPQNTFAFFLTSQTQGFASGPGGSQGDLCLGGAIGRYVGPGQVQSAGTAGEISLAIDLMSMPSPGGFVSVVAGSTWNFQCWYRDANPTVTSNFTDGVSITF